MPPHWQATPYAVPSAFAALVCLGLIPVVARRRGVAGRAAFLALLACLAVWSGAHALMVSATDLSTKILLCKVQVLGSATAPLAWLAFALGYTGLGSSLTRAASVLVATLPLTTVVLAFTNNRHRLIWRQITLVRDAPFAALAVEHGPWFSVQTTYSYLLVLLSSALVVWMLSQSPHQRRQLVGVIVAPLLVCVVNLLHLTGWSPLPNLDLTPFSFALGALALVATLFRDPGLGVIAVARHSVLEGMSEAVVVLDQRGRVYDLNPAARRVLGLSASEAVGQPLPRLLEAGRPDPPPNEAGPTPWEVTL